MKKIELASTDLMPYSFLEAWYQARKRGYKHIKKITVAKKADGHYDVCDKEMLDFLKFMQVDICRDSKLTDLDEWWITFGNWDNDKTIIVGSKGA